MKRFAVLLILAITNFSYALELSNKTYHSHEEKPDKKSKDKEVISAEKPKKKVDKELVTQVKRLDNSETDNVEQAV